MKHAVTGKQHNSRMCFICGMRNAYGLKTSFFSVDRGGQPELVAIFTTAEEHQSYPGRLHGGVAAAVLDDTIGRAILLTDPGDVWGVTVEFSIKYRKPIPTGVQLRAVGRLGECNKRFFEGSGELLLPDGSVAAEAKGRYIRMRIGQIADFNFDVQEWKVHALPDDPREIELPDKA
jgi:uncharacterized protein (TIGR00369 family)